MDVLTALSPLETLRVAQSPFAKVVKEHSTLVTVFGLLNMRKADSPWHDVRLRWAVNYAINRADLIRYAAKGAEGRRAQVKSSIHGEHSRVRMGHNQIMSRKEKHD